MCVHDEDNFTSTPAEIPAPAAPADPSTPPADPGAGPATPSPTPIMSPQEAIDKVSQTCTAWDLANVAAANMVSPADLNRMDQQWNSDWWNQQGTNYFGSNTGMNGAASLNPNDSTQYTFDGSINQPAETNCHAASTNTSLDYDALRTDQNGYYLDRDRAVASFGGDTNALHKYMYATNPVYKARYDNMIQQDPPAIPVKGPVEGIATALAVPESIPGKVVAGLRTTAMWTAIQDARDTWRKKSNWDI